MKYKVTAIIILVLIVIAGTAFYFLNANKTKIDNMAEIEKSILNSDKINDETKDGEIEVTHLSRTHARARVGDLEVFLVNINPDWRIVSDSSTPIYCEKMQAIGFPANFVLDCILKNPETVSSEIARKKLLDKESGSMDVVAIVSYNQDPACDCINLDIGGEHFTFGYPDSFPISGLENINEGDSILVNVGVGDNEELVINDIDEVLPSSKESANRYDSGDDSDDDLSDEPDSTPYQRPTLHFLDIDNSNAEIQLIGD